MTSSARTIIRNCTIAEIETSPALSELLKNYGDESSIPELGEVSACMDMYRAMEASGALRAIGAFDGGNLVGLVTMLVYGLPHYSGRRVAVTESLFVLPLARKGGAGIRLIHAAEELARELGVMAFMISAPVGSILAEVLPRIGYRETNRVFLRGMA